MKVILLHDVESLGHEGEAVQVADGYANNHLLPRKLAEKCTRANLAALEQRRRAIERRQVERRTAGQEVADRLVAAGVTIEAQVGEGGRLHGQVTPHQIAEAIAAQLQTPVDRRRITVSAPLREVGEYMVRVTLYKDVHCDLPVRVVSAGGESPSPAPQAKAPAPPVAEGEALAAPLTEATTPEPQ